MLNQLFQSTAPVWGPTVYTELYTTSQNISIHGPRVGADADYMGYPLCAWKFQSTAPVWGPTFRLCRDKKGYAYFNPRPPCGGPTTAAFPIWATSSYFNPRPPCGGRPIITPLSLQSLKFQSTAPVWGPTAYTGSAVAKQLIFQSTAPVWGPTANVVRVADKTEFQSTAPVWGPTYRSSLLGFRWLTISIHGPRVGADYPPPAQNRGHFYFNPRPPCGGRR